MRGRARGDVQPGPCLRRYRCGLEPFDTVSQCERSRYPPRPSGESRSGCLICWPEVRSSSTGRWGPSSTPAGSTPATCCGRRVRSTRRPTSCARCTPTTWMQGLASSPPTPTRPRFRRWSAPGRMPPEQGGSSQPAPAWPRRRPASSAKSTPRSRCSSPEDSDRMGPIWLMAASTPVPTASTSLRTPVSKRFTCRASRSWWGRGSTCSPWRRFRDWMKRGRSPPWSRASPLRPSAGSPSRCAPTAPLLLTVRRWPRRRPGLSRRR